MDEQRTIVHRDDDYEVTCTVPVGVVVLSGIDRIDTEGGTVYVLPSYAMSSGSPIKV